MRKAGFLFLAVFLLASIVAVPVSHAEEQQGRTTTPAQESMPVERGGVLIPPGTLVIEPGFQYAYTSRARISISGFTLLESIVLGKIVSEDVKRDIISASLSFRWGLTRHTQFEIKVPWIYRRDREYSTTDSGQLEEKSVNTSALGDIEAALYAQVLREHGSLPDIVLSIRGKSITGKGPYDLHTKIDENGQRVFTERPTGSGHYGLSGGVTISKTSDPAVLFFSLGYFYNFERDVGTNYGVYYGKIDPGDSVEYGLGIAYALNERLSTSITYQQRFVSATTQDGAKVVGTDANVTSMYWSVSHSITPSTSIFFSAGIGLTRDAPDTSIEVRLPIYF